MYARDSAFLFPTQTPPLSPPCPLTAAQLNQAVLAVCYWLLPLAAPTGCRWIPLAATAALAHGLLHVGPRCLNAPLLCRQRKASGITRLEPHDPRTAARPGTHTEREKRERATGESLHSPHNTIFNQTFRALSSARFRHASEP